MPIAYLIQTRGVGVTTKRRVHHLHLDNEPDALCGHARVGDNWRSVGDLASFLRTPEGLFVRQKRLCAICAALRKPYEALDRARHCKEAT
jgi:hypothetical protein